MTRTVQVQKVYKDKVQELIAVQDAQMHNAGVQVEGDFKTNRTLLITTALISIAAGCVMGWYIVRSITRPLDEAVRFAEAIADGDLTRHITTDYKDETGVLLQALMAMKTRLLDIVQEVQNGSESISTAAAQIVAGNRIWPRVRKNRPARLKKRRRRWNRLPPRLKTQLTIPVKRPNSLPAPPA